MLNCHRVDDDARDVFSKYVRACKYLHENREIIIIIYSFIFDDYNRHAPYIIFNKPNELNLFLPVKIVSRYGVCKVVKLGILTKSNICDSRSLIVNRMTGFSRI